MSGVVCSPHLENVRVHAENEAQQRAASRLEQLEQLVAACDATALSWYQLDLHTRQRICRVCDTAGGGDSNSPRGWQGLAARLGADHISCEWYRQQTRGELRGPTELMLTDLHDGGRRRLPVSLVLHFLMDSRHWRCLTDIHDQLLAVCERVAAGSESPGRPNSCESGIVSHSSGEIVGSLKDIGDDEELLDAVPQTPGDDDGDDDLKKPPLSPPPSPPLTMSLDKKKQRPQSPTPVAATGPIVLLTYAADGHQYALQVAAQLKRATTSRVAFRVFLLEEQRRWSEPDHYSIVLRWFEEIDFVVAILTPEYLAATQNKSSQEVAAVGDGAEALRRRKLAEDARFLYTLMCARLEKHGHVNWWYRCVVPDRMVARLRRHPLYGTPIFRWPYPISAVEELAECLAY